jgi:hypothetical protein
MTIFILHFECQTTAKTPATLYQSADMCSIGDSFEQAEEQGRALIASHGYTAGNLIAFSRVEPEKIARLSQDEATLYLRAQQHTPPCAVFFN